MLTLDSRRYHRRPAPAAARPFSKNEQSTTLSDPYGGLGGRTGWALSRQQIQPLIQGLGLGTGRQARRLQADIESGRARGPLADAIRSIQQFAPDVLPAAMATGERVSREGEAAVGGLQEQIRQAQAALPRYQQAADKGLGASRQGLAGAQSAFGRAQQNLPGLEAAAARGLAGTEAGLAAAQEALRQGQADMPAARAAAQAGLTGAQEQLGLARGYTTGPAITGAEGALNLAQRYAQRAASPIGEEDLYQHAARRVMQQIRPGLAARGLEAGGAGAQMETDALRNLTFDFAQRRSAEQQQTLQSQLAAAQGLSGVQQAGLAGVGNAVSGIQGAARGLADLPTALNPLVQSITQAGQGVQQGALGSAAVSQSILPFVQALQQGGLGLQQAAQGGAALSQAGVPLAQQGVGAVSQLGEMLQQRYGIPMQQSGALLNLLTAGTQPGLSLLGQTGPIPTTSGKGFRII
jgi:hypothetical protein